MNEELNQTNPHPGWGAFTKMPNRVKWQGYFLVDDLPNSAPASRPRPHTPSRLWMDAASSSPENLANLQKVADHLASDGVVIFRGANFSALPGSSEANVPLKNRVDSVIEVGGGAVLEKTGVDTWKATFKGVPVGGVVQVNGLGERRLGKNVSAVAASIGQHGWFPNISHVGYDPATGAPFILRWQARDASYDASTQTLIFNLKTLYDLKGAPTVFDISQKLDSVPTTFAFDKPTSVFVDQQQGVW